MALPEANTRVLEDGDDALLENEQPGEAEVVGEGDDLGEEFASLDELAPEKPEDKAAAAKPAAKPVVGATTGATGEDDDLPAEFKGKSRKEIAKMYQEAHSTIGRQGSELGEYRRKADQVIQASLRVLQAQQAGQRPAAADVATAAKGLPEESEIFAKPIDSINRLVENHPIIQEIRKTLGVAAANDASRRAEVSGERFHRAHPDAQDILRDTKFREWVTASPIRRDLLLRANNQYDFDAGDEVFSTWKALHGKAKPTAGDTDGATDGASTAAAATSTGAPGEAEVKQAAQTLARARAAKAAQASAAAAAQAAAAPTGGASAAPSKGGKKLYRRTDVIRLMVEDPDRYEALSPELSLAYAEGRVR